MSASLFYPATIKFSPSVYTGMIRSSCTFLSTNCGRFHRDCTRNPTQVYFCFQFRVFRGVLLRSIASPARYGRAPIVLRLPSKGRFKTGRDRLNAVVRVINGSLQPRNLFQISFWWHILKGFASKTKPL